MSKKRRNQRNKFPASYYKVKRERASIPPSIWTIRDKLSLIGAIALAMLAISTSFIIRAVSERRKLDEGIEKWRMEFKLSEEQIIRLRQIEHDFHSPWNPFSEGEKNLEMHHAEIASAMGPEAGKRFLEGFVHLGN